MRKYYNVNEDYERGYEDGRRAGLSENEIVEDIHSDKFRQFFSFIEEQLKPFAEKYQIELKSENRGRFNKWFVLSKIGKFYNITVLVNFNMKAKTVSAKVSDISYDSDVIGYMLDFSESLKNMNTLVANIIFAQQHNSFVYNEFKLTPNLNLRAKSLF